MKKDSTRTGATLCSSMRPRSATTSWLNKFKLLAFAFMALLSINAWGADEVYKETAFSSTNNSKGTSSYTDTWTSTNNGFGVTINGFNNNNNNWDNGATIKAGAKKSKASDPAKVSSSYIATSAAIDKSITKIVVYGSLANNNTLASTLSVADNNAFTSNNVNISGPTSFTDGAMTFNVSGSGLPAQNKFYKVAFTVTNNTTSNGSLVVTKVEYYYSAGPTTFSVTYDKNGATSGSVPTDATAYTSGQSVTVLGNTGNLAKTGKKFNGWNSNTSGTGTNYAVGSTFNISANTTLYAKWDDITYTDYLTDCSTTYSFNPIGVAAGSTGYGTVSPTSVTGIPESSAVTVDGNTFTVNGTPVTATPSAETAEYTYAFSSWSNLPNTVTADVSNIVANFTRTARTYNVTYKDQGGGDYSGNNAGSLVANYTYGTGATLVAGTKYGFNFEGWYDNQACTGTAVTNISNSATGNKTYYAKWSEDLSCSWNLQGTFTASQWQLISMSKETGHSAENVAYVTQYINAGNYWFKFFNSNGDYDIGAKIGIHDTNENFTMCSSEETSADLEARVSGDYRFKLDWSTDFNCPTISVYYPAYVTVTFNMNGHGDAIADKYCVPGGIISAPANPSAANYSFGGWYENASCTGDAFNFGTTLSADKTLYAKWTFQAPTYYYRGGDNNWGATEMTPSADHLYSYIQSSNSTNQFKISKTTTGYDYNYSYVDKGFNGTNVSNIGDYGSNNCYCWQSGTYYIIIYYPNTAINTSSSPKICASTSLPGNFYVDGGAKLYFDNTLGNWAEGKQHLRIGRGDHSMAVPMTKVTGTANLYECTVPEYANYFAFTVANSAGWTGIDNTIYQPSDKQPTGDYAITEELVYQNYLLDVDYTLLPTSKGSTDKGCTYINTNHEPGMKMQNVSITEYSHGTVNVAYTDIDGSASNFTTGNRNVAHTCILTITATPETGARLVSLKVNGNNFTSGQTFVADATTEITAVFSNEWTLTWDYAGGSVVSAGTAAGSVAYGTSLTAPKLEKTGYDFAGWNPAVPATMPAANSTYTAQWTASNYTVTLYVNGGTINSGNVTSYTYGTGATLPTDVTKTDYKFRGWYSNEGLTEGPVTAIGTTETGNKEFWAKWEETTYSNYRTRCDNYWYVTYNANGKEIAEDLPTDDYGYGDNHTDKVTLSTVTLTTTGYTHIGWNTDPDATEALASPHIITGNTTFYAIWTPQVYTISYKDQGGGDYSGSNSALLPTSHTYNTATNLVDGVKEGARFEGWYKNDACTEGPVTTLGATEYTANITLYAKWTAVYAITYTIPDDGGTLATGAPTSAASGETVTMPGLQGGNQVPAPYDCETLIGWTTNSAAYESKTGAMPTPFYAVDANSPAISGATTFYAVYSRAQGTSGTISLTNQEIKDNFYHNDDNGNYGVENSYTNSAGNWKTNGYTKNNGNIQLDASATYYFQIPTQAENLTSITITHNSNTSDRTLSVKTATNGEVVGTKTVEDHTSETTWDVSDLNIKTAFIYCTSYTLQIQSVTATYGAPNIISTGLNCSNDILEFTVTYNANAGQFPNATTSCTSPDEHTFNGDDPETNPYTICSDATCEGMTLVGWNSQMDGQGGLNYTPGQEISSVSQDEFTLYAQFAYNVNVKDNDDFQEDVHPSERGGSINLNGGIDVCSPAKYDFIGWTTDNPETWKQTITKPAIFSNEGVTTYTPEAVGTQVTAVYGMSTSVGSQAFYIGYDDAGTPTYLTMSPSKWKKTTNIDDATSIYKETITAEQNKYHLYYMDNGVKTYIYYNGSGLATGTSVVENNGWVITTSGAVTTIQSIQYPGKYFSYSGTQFTDHANPNPLAIYTGAKEYKYYDETTCTDEITITFNAGGGTMDPVTTQVVGHEGDVITVPTCSYPGWTFLGWVNTPAEAQSDIKKADDLIYTNEDGHEYTIGAQSETLYAYYTKTPEPPTFDGNISDVWKIYVPVVVNAEYVNHYEVGAKNISDASAHGEYTTTTRCIDGTDWAFTNVGTNQFTIQNPEGLYLSGAQAGDDNDIFFSANPSVWTMENKDDKGYKFVNQNTPNRYLAFRVGNGAPTFINTSTANEGNPSSYSYIKIGGCTAPVYTTSPGGEFKLNMLGNVRVTSTNGKTVRSVDALSISADNLTPNTAITLSADPAVLTFCDATGAALSLTTDGTGKLANTAVYVKYTPTAYNTTQTPAITATCGEQHQNFAGLVTGRSLPEKFIIAQKVGDDWYALPNDMSNDQTNPAAVKISVVNEETGTATIYSDVTDHLAYQLQSKGTGTGVAFSSPIKDNNIIRVNTTAARNTLGLYAQSSWSGQDVKYYEFTPVTSDLEDYTLQNVFQTNYLGITEGNWGIGASNNVRFLAINQQPAATITWQNEMLETQHAQNAAEDGVITLPTIANPIACERAIAAGWVFFGWGDQIATTKTAEPTILVGGEVAKADKTYYAIFRRGTENVWRTSCPTVNTITYTANGGEGTDYVVYTELTTATAITVETAGFTKEGSQFIGWTVEGSEDNLIQPNGKISGINSDIIVKAQWMGNLVISGDVQLTSADGQKVATAATGITFSSTDMSYATELRITYRDETNEIDYPRSGDHSYTSSEFRLCYDSYNVADDGNISLAGVTGAYEQTYSISYTPKGGVNTLDHYTMKVEVLRSATVIATETKDLYGRTLPEKFAIVAHVGDMWYALPNNMDKSNTYAPVAVSVDNSDASILNWTATGAKTAGYSMKQMTADYNKLRFAAIAAEESSQACLWAAESGKTGIRNWSPNSTDAAYQWAVAPQGANFQAYKMTSVHNTKTLRLNGSLSWGMYASGGTDVVYFIPLTDKEVADFQVIEWFANKVLIETNNQAINTSAAKTSVGSGEYTPSAVDGTTYGTNQYTLTTGDLTTSAGQSLNIQYQTTAGDAWYMNSVKVPIIVSQGEYATSTDLLGGLDARSNYKDNDLVVRDGATLTMDATTGTWNTFKNVTIYPTSKVVVPAEKTLSTATTTLFGGIDEIYNGSTYNMTTYAVPQLVLKGNLTHSATVQGLRYDMRLDDAIYYDFALPYQSKYEIVTDNKGGENFTYWIKLYDGDARAKGGTGWAWYNWNVQPWMINVGTGYLFAAQPYAGQNFIIIRHPMGYHETENPNGHQTGTSEGSKASVAVAAYPSTYDNNTGWNFIANPFLANFSKDDETNAVIKTGQLVEHKVNEKWDGHYEWNTSEGKDVRYVTTYNYATGHYYQQKMSEAVLPPFTGFFVQIANEGSVVFDLGGRADAAPARMLSEDELPSEIEVTLKVKGQSESDETVMLLTKDLSLADAREFPAEQTKMVNNGVLNYYTYAGDDIKMYANGMNYEEGQEWNKAGIMVKTAGEYTFSANGVNENYVEQVLLKDMDSNTEYDLMSNDAKIYLDKGEMNDRFYVKIVFGKHNIGTGMTERYDTSGPEKFILNDHMYIRANGVLFDGVGKRVKY